MVINTSFVRHGYRFLAAYIEFLITTYQVKNLLLKRDKANTTLLMAAAEGGSKDTFEAAVGATATYASGKVHENTIAPAWCCHKRLRAHVVAVLNVTASVASPLIRDAC